MSQRVESSIKILGERGEKREERKREERQKKRKEKERKQGERLGVNGVDEGKNQQHQQKKRGGGGGKHNVGEGGEMRRKLGNSKKGGKEKW